MLPITRATVLNRGTGNNKIIKPGAKCPVGNVD